ncbi:MAG: NAD(P)H-dependent oxidoreductase subunit E [Actinomycetota bacterium]|nr:NAD(P)H-dependent oxidoreductase subunit E [Actinomycetota bacterium]
MSRLSPDNLRRAKELMGLYPEPRSALIPMLHIAQEQDGWLTPDVISHVAELVELSPAEVYGTASFYDMFFTHPVGRYLVSVCTNLACLLNGGYELLAHAEERLGVAAGSTTDDGEFTLEEVECIALCGAAPCLAVNWRFFGDVTDTDFDRLVDDLRTGRLADKVPSHGTLCRVRRKVAADASADARKGRQASESANIPVGLSLVPEEIVEGGPGEPQPAHPRATAGATGHARAIRVAGHGTSERDADGASDDGDGKPK